MQILKSASVFIFVLFLGCGGGNNAPNSSSSSMPPQPAVWTKQFGVAGGSTYGKSVATDSAGYIYVSGYTAGGLDGNPAVGVSDLFVTKYDASGNRLYTRLLGATGMATNGFAVATDVGGNVYVTGYTNGGLGGNSVTGSTDVFLSKLDPNGNWLYTKQLGVSGTNTYGNAVATDSNGNIYVSGTTHAGLDGNSLTGWSDFFLIKFDAAGNKLYTKQLGVSGKATGARGVAVDSNGNVYVSGDTYGGLDGSAPTNSPSIFITKFDSIGNKLFTKVWGASGTYSRNGGIATDASGNVYISGNTDAGHNPNALPATVDALLIKYDAAGNLIFTRQWGQSGRFSFGQAIATDNSGNIYISGQTDGALDGNNSTGWVQPFISKFDASGNRLFTTQTSAGPASALANGVATDAAGKAYITGETGGSLNGNSQTGSTDFFLQKF